MLNTTIHKRYFRNQEERPKCWFLLKFFILLVAFIRASSNDNQAFDQNISKQAIECAIDTLSEEIKSNNFRSLDN